MTKRARRRVEPDTPAMRCAACHATIASWRTPCPACGRPARIEERWVLLEPLGEGASGTTWKARDTVDDRLVAVKELAVGRARSLKAIELFEREARALERLDHPGVPDFIADVTVEAPGSVSLYLVQELIDGRTLALGEGDEREVLAVIAELCDVLAYLHGRRPPVIHRDVKPANVMRRADGRLALIDFGSVRHAVQHALGGSTVAGTFGYMAPEQLRGVAVPASDLYATGALAVALLAGRDAAELVDPIRPGRWREQITVSPALGDLLERLLEPDHDKRPQSAADVAREARALLTADGQAVPARPARPSARPSARAPRRREPPQDDRATARLIRGDLRAWRRHERWIRLDNGDLLLAPVLASPVLFWGGFALFSAINGATGADLGLGEGAIAAAALVTAWFALAVLRRAQARAHHPWTAGALRRGLMRLWPAHEELIPGVTALMGEEPRPASFDGSAAAAAARAWADDPRLIPLLEARAWSLHHHREHANAADVLEQALGIGERHFGADDVRYLDQLARYASMASLSTGHRDLALARRRQAEQALIALERAHGAPREALLERALDDLAERHGVASAEPPEATARRLRAFRWRLRRHLHLPGPGRWVNLLLVAMPGFFVGALAGGLLYALLVAIGALDPTPNGDSSFKWLLLGGALTPVAVATALGTFWPARLVPDDWRDLYPDLDATWPLTDTRRARVIEALERVWRDPFGGAKAASQAVVQLTASGADRLARLMGGEGPANLAALMRGERGAPSGDPTPRQALQLAELDTFRAWYAEAVLENLQRLDALPVDHRPRRARLYEVQAHRALDARLPDAAAHALRRAGALRA